MLLIRNVLLMKIQKLWKLILLLLLEIPDLIECQKIDQ